jgi:tape measure domain-containing protein
MASEVKTAISLEDRISPAVAKMNRALASTEDQMSKVDSASDRVGKNSGFASMGESIEGTGTKSGWLATKIGLISGVMQSVTGAAIGAFSGLSGDIIEASDSAQKFGQTLKFAGMGDAEIQKLTASTQKYADQTVYSISDIRNITSQLAANGVKGYSSLAEAAGNLNAVAGGNADTFKSVGMVLTQTAGAGKLTTENWNQLADAIPGASGVLQKAMLKNGAYTGNFRDAMAKGEITADEFNKAIQDVGMTDVAKQAATSTQTIEGAWGNLQASAVSIGTKILDSVKPAVTGAMSSLADLFSNVGTGMQGVLDILLKGDYTGALREAFGLEEDSPIVDFLFNLRDTALSMFNSVKEGASQLWGIMKPILSGIMGAIPGIVSGIGALINGAKPILTVIGGALVTAMVAAWTVTEKVIQVLGKFGDWLSSHQTVATVFATAIGGLVLAWKALQAAAAVNTFFESVQAAGGLVGMIKNLTVVTNIQKTATAAWSAVTKIGTGIQMAFNAVMAINPFVLIIVAIAAVVAALVWFFTQTKVGQQAWQTFTTWLSGLWTGFVAFAQGVWNGFAAFWSGLWTAVSSAFSAIWNALVAFFSPIIQGIYTIIYDVIIVIAAIWVTIWNGISAVFTAIWNGIVAFFTPIINGIYNTIATVITAVLSVWQAVWSAISSFFSSVWQGMVSFFTPIINSIRNIISSVLNDIRNTWNSVWGAISGFFGGIWLGMVWAVGNAVGAIGGAVGRIWGVVMGPLWGAGSWLGDVGHNIISGLIGGITGAFGWLKSTISNLGSSVVGWAKDVLGIHSPSKVFRNEVGKMIGLGLGDGIAASTGYVTDKMDDMITAATPKIPSPTFSTGTTGGDYDGGNGTGIGHGGIGTGGYPGGSTFGNGSAGSSSTITNRNEFNIKSDDPYAVATLVAQELRN